jgi:hypothetical protein
MTRIRRAGALAAAPVLMLALSGCVGGAAATTSTPVPPPAATAEPSTLPTPSADEALDAVTTLVVKPNGVQLTDQGGTVSVSLDYLAEPADAVGVLAKVFDAEPVIESHEGSSHFPPSTSYRWDGFVLWEQLPVDWLDGVETSLVHPRFLVQVTAGGSDGVELRSSDGRHVGDGWSELLAAPTIMTNPSGCSGPYADYVEVDAGAGALMKVSVDFRPTEDLAAIGVISAPVPVYEDGCA